MPSVSPSRRERGIAAVLALCIAVLGLAAAGPGHTQEAPGVWEATGSLGAARYAHTATRLDGPACAAPSVPDWCGGVLVVGGSTTLSSPGPPPVPPVPTNTAELFRPATGQWTAATPMSEPRTGHTATLLEGPACTAQPTPEWCGQILVAGGANINEAQPSTHKALAEAALYDPVTGTWTPTGALGTARTQHTATQLLDGRVLVAGGFAPGTPITTDPVAELWDPATGEWTDTGALSTPRRSHHTSTLLIGSRCDVADPPAWCGMVLVAKGRSATGTATPFSERFDPDTGQWENATVSLDRSGHAGTLLPDGRVFVTGGANSGEPQASVELYEPSNQTWFGLGVMHNRRAEHTATLLTDGRVLVAGGNQGTNTEPLAGRTAELSDVSGTQPGPWARAGSLIEGRYMHTATLLTAPGCAPLCDRVLVAGGRGPAGALATSELFDPTVDPPPDAVADLTALANSHTKVTLTWSAVGSNGEDRPPAGDYIVKQSRNPITEETFEGARSLCDGGVCSYEPASIGTRLKLTVSQLLPKTTYHYAVKAVDEAGQSGPMSNVAEVRTQRDTVAPGAVTDLRAKALRRHRIKLKWSATGSDGRKPPPVRKYLIKQSLRPITSNRRFNKADKLCVCTYEPPEVGATLDAILRYGRRSKGTTFHYALKPIDDSGNRGPLSNSVKARVR